MKGKKLGKNWAEIAFFSLVLDTHLVDSEGCEAAWERFQ